MNSDANELQFHQPFTSGVLRDRQHYISSAMLLMGLGPGSDTIISMEVPHSEWNQNIKRMNETICPLLSLYYVVRLKLQLLYISW